MSGKRVATKPKKKVKKRTLFTVFSMFNLFWYTIAVLVANFHDHMILCVDGGACLALWYQNQRQIF